jgi:hypothetical protein
MENVVFNAAPVNGYKVKEWINNGTIVSSNKTNTYTLSTLTAPSNITVEFEVATGIDDNGLVQIEFYPNPFKSFINIKSSTLIAQVEISNIIGQVMNVIYINNKTGRIDTQNLRNGVYIIRTIDINGKISTRKLIKE